MTSHPGSRPRSRGRAPHAGSFVLGTVLMLLLGVLHGGGSAAAQSQTGAGEQQGQEAPGADAAGGSIEVHVAECPPGFQGESGDAWYDACHGTPIEGVEVTVTSANGAESSGTTEQIEDGGPGVVTFGDLPAGEQAIAVDLPEAQVADVFAYCSVADGDDEIPVAPNDALTGTLTLAEDQDVICDWYIVPAAGDDAGTGTTIDLFAFACDPATLPRTLPPTGEPDYREFAGACTEPAEGVSFHLVDDASGQDLVQATDADGRTDFALDPSVDYRFYADVPLEADEYLWCSVDNGEARAMRFDDRGVTTFASGEPVAYTCSWFLIEAEASSASTPEPTTTPTAVPTATAEPDGGVNAAAPTAAPTTAVEATTEDAAEQGGQQGPEDGERGRITVTVTTCPQDSGNQATDFESLRAACTEPVDDVGFTLTGPDGATDERVVDAGGGLAYLDLASGTYMLYSDVPLEAASEYLYCTADSGNRYQKEFDEAGVTTFGDLQREQIACDWFVVPTSVRTAETGASLEVHLAACPVDYTGDRLFDDCHGNGIADGRFTLTGPGGERTGTTTVEQKPGPGTVSFTGLGAGDYTLLGGPPGDFGRVELVCTAQPGGEAVEARLDGATATFAVSDGQDILCDWYYLPEDASGGAVTPTSTPAPEPAWSEILVTLYACPASDGGYGGATFGQLTEQCTEPVDGVPFTLGDPGAAPLKASTGASGDGAVRFYDLQQAGYTLAPVLGTGRSSVAVFCSIDDGEPYQKALENGATRFSELAGESIGCSWFMVERPATRAATGPAGSITIREYRCEKDRKDITDWDAECVPGPSGSSFTLTPSATGTGRDGTPNAQGVFVFDGLADGFYELDQNDGMWCRAVADRVDRDSRVIVEDGGNTDVVLYHCSAAEDLPDTGTGPGGTIAPQEDDGLPAAAVAAIIAGVLAAPLLVSVAMRARNRRRAAAPDTVDAASGPVMTASGRAWMRFR